MHSLSKAQEARVKRVHKAFQVVGTLRLQDFKSLMQLNLIKDNNTTTEDINLVEKAHRPNVESLKEKSTRES